MKINNQVIGEGKTYIIAEAGVNHNGDIDLAKELIIKAKESGADAVKFQSFQAQEMCIRSLEEKKEIQALTKGSNSAYDMYKALELSREDHKELFDFAARENITLFTSVFDLQALSFLIDLGTPALKISSGDVTFLPLIKEASLAGIPVLLSVGMASLSEIAKACEILEQGKSPFALLHCTALYPPKANEVNLNFMKTLYSSFAVITGFSDHTEGITASLAAVAMGASVIEKHFTLDNNMDGPDHKLSLDPSAFSAMVKGIREIEVMKGEYVRIIPDRERAGIHPGRRGLKFRKNIKSGTVITIDDITSIKPQTGIAPEFMNDVIGRKVLRDVEAAEPVSWVDLG